MRFPLARFTATVFIVALSACSPEPSDATVLRSDGLVAMVGRGNGPLTETLVTDAVLVDVGGGCLGLRIADELHIAVFPLGTSLESGRIRMPGLDPAAVGDTLELSGGADYLPDGLRERYTLPTECTAVGLEYVWYIRVPEGA